MRSSCRVRAGGIALRSPKAMKMAAGAIDPGCPGRCGGGIFLLAEAVDRAVDGGDDQASGGDGWRSGEGGAGLELPKLLAGL